MPRNRMFLAVAAAGLLASGALASAVPEDSGVLTNALIPLRGGSGGGTASIQIDWRAKKVCYAAEPTGLTGTLTGAIVKGNTVLVPLKSKPNGEVAGCSDIDPETAKAIIASPADYALSVKDGSQTLLAALSPINNFK